MIRQEIKREWNVAYLTALGRMCEDREPTERQLQIAKIEADNHIRACIEEEKMEEALKKWIRHEPEATTKGSTAKK